jgi:hypothetical protein
MIVTVIVNNYLCAQILEEIEDYRANILTVLNEAEQAAFEEYYDAMMNDIYVNYIPEIVSYKFAKLEQFVNDLLR